MAAQAARAGEERVRRARPPGHQPRAKVRARARVRVRVRVRVWVGVRVRPGRGGLDQGASGRADADASGM